jgi:hypothetical protein
MKDIGNDILDVPAMTVRSRTDPDIRVLRLFRAAWCLSARFVGATEWSL